MEDISLIAQKYGWCLANAGTHYTLCNRKGAVVCKLFMRGSKYVFKDLSGNKIMSGTGQLASSLEKLLTKYYFAKAV